MKNKMWIILLTVAAMLPLPYSEAHSPYLIKVKNTKTPAGEPLVFEKLYGDGIIFSDPVQLQVRNKNGVIIAQTSTALHVCAICPSLAYCWVFPYDDLIVRPLRLDYTKLDYDAKNSKPLSVDLQNYLNSPAGAYIRSPEGFYPSFGEDKLVNFKPASPAFKLLSPFIVAIDNQIPLLILGCLYGIPAFLFAYFFRWVISSTDKTQKWLILFGNILLLFYIVVVLLISLILSWGIGLFFSQIIAASLWVVGGKLAADKLYIRLAKQTDAA